MREFRRGECVGKEGTVEAEMALAGLEQGLFYGFVGGGSYNFIRIC